VEMMAEVKHASLPLQRINYERKSAIPSATEFCQKFGFLDFSPPQCWCKSQPILANFESK
jgi:hypothetical protein